MCRVEKWSGELVGRIRCEGSVVDSAVKALTEVKAPAGCVGIEKPGADALSDVSEGALRKDAACQGTRAKHARFASRPGQDVVEGRSDVLAKPAAGGRTGTLGRRRLYRLVRVPVRVAGTTWWQGRWRR